MEESALLAMLRQAEDRMKQLEYRIKVLEDLEARNAQLLASLRSAAA